ncbi:hypothetical protein IJ096_02500, partial [Candidatus Saccharibacteria bacterium]|nr:hypothetical protein [Candidatus Saccharibacteria bacterium]
MNNEKAERIERSIAEVAQEVYALGLEMQENQKRINEIMATEATDRPDYMRIHNIVPQIRKKVEELAGRRNELLKNLRGQLASEVEAYPTVRAEIAKIDAEMDKNREIMNNTRPTGFSRNRFYAAVHENERLQGRKDMIINKGVDDRLAMMGIGANETLLNSDNNAEGVSVEGGANGAGASNVAANEAGDVAAETEGEAVTGAEPATVEAEGEPVVEEEIVETGESVSEDEGVNESPSENEGAGEQNDDGENLSELRDAYEIVAEETLDRQKKLINYLEGVNGDELNEEELRKIDELTEAVNRMMETWERDGDNLKTIGGEAEYRTVEDDKNEILSNVDEYRNNPAFVKYQEMRFGDGEGGVGESGNDESGNDESGEDVEIDEAFERDEQKFADIEKELGGEALKMIAVDTGANAAALENLARQMAVDELAFAKRQRAGEMAKASGLAKLKLIAKGALLENSLIRNIRLGRKKKEIFENMQATGSAYAKWVHDENGDRVSNYNEMTGTAGDRGIIERFKNYIRAGVDESMMGEGDEMSGAEDGEKTEALKARLSGMVDKIVAGDEGAWGEYQNWVRESRENGFFTGQEGRKENRNFSADNIMSMGDKVRKMAEQYKDNEDALAKIREYVANNTALYMAKAEVGINTEVKLDQMGTMIANIGLPATLVASAVGRAAKSNVMKGLTVGASAAIAGGFGGVKGFFDARATMSQVDVAQALGGDRDMEKAGTGMFAKSKGSKEKLETYKTISVDEILGESGLGRIMERDEEGNWRLKEGVENNEETMRELAGIVGNLRAALAVGSERNVDLVTYNVDEGGDLGQIEEQKTQLNWAMAEAMRLLRENSSEENNYTDLVEAAESERALGYNEEIDEINRSRKEYQMDVIAKTAAMAAFAGGTVRFAKTVALPWLQENHPEALPNIMRGAKAANKVSSVAGAEDAKDAIDGISEDLANAGMEGGGQPKTSLNAIINALSIRRGVGASVDNGEAGYTGAQVDIAMNAAVGTDGNGGGDLEIDTLRSAVPNTSNSGIAMRLK